jgi:beta-glucosidase
LQVLVVAREGIAMARTFPVSFSWGSATASYQVEGAVAEDGREPSIWDTFCARPGAIEDGSNGDVACDQYHRYAEDIEVMKRIGLDAYRFSIAWPRIIPTESGEVNQPGVDYYKRLVDALLEAGISPVATLYHWDLPQYLQDAGGWPARDTAYRMAEYVQVMADALGDRVRTWITINEPWCAAYLGYATGEQAPGIRDEAQALAAAHHLNLAHGLSAQAIRGGSPKARVAITLNLQHILPASESDADRDAADQLRRVGNEIFLGPLLEGRYDPLLLEETAQVSDWSFLRDGDLEVICQPLDALGLNYYYTSYARRIPDGITLGRGEAGTVAFPGATHVQFLPPEPPLTAMGWPQYPDGLYQLLMDLHRRWPDLPVLITENGAAFDDVVAADGRVHDPERIAYLHAHISAVHRALEDGANVVGYFVWSLLDNFEWAYGYTKRFGITYTDYPTQARIPKDSSDWFRELAATGTIPG